MSREKRLEEIRLASQSRIYLRPQAATILFEEIDRLQSQLAIAKQALEFYAQFDQEGTMGEEVTNLGSKARKALKALKNLG